jgi:DNA-binding XRE family transcriptional regulator
VRHGARAAQPVGTRLLYRPIDFGAVMNSAAPSEEIPGPGQEEPAGEATVLRMLLRAQLRRLREAADTTTEKAGYEIRASRSKISRIETGRVGLKLRDIEDLLTLYGVADERERTKVLALARRSREPEWWTQYHDILPD